MQAINVTVWNLWIHIYIVAEPDYKYVAHLKLSSQEKFQKQYFFNFPINSLHTSNYYDNIYTVIYAVLSDHYMVI